MATRRVRTVARTTVPPTVDWGGIDTRRVEHEGGSGIFAQGDAATSVMYIERGSVRLSVVSPSGKEAVVAVLGPRTFFGEGCLAGQALELVQSALRVTDPQPMRRHLQTRFARFVHRITVTRSRIRPSVTAPPIVSQIPTAQSEP